MKLFFIFWNIYLQRSMDLPYLLSIKGVNDEKTFTNSTYIIYNFCNELLKRNEG